MYGGKHDGEHHYTCPGQCYATYNEAEKRGVKLYSPKHEQRRERSESALIAQLMDPEREQRRLQVAREEWRQQYGT